MLRAPAPPTGTRRKLGGWAESCTAGIIAPLLAQAEGANDIPHGGFTTYTKEQKTKVLDVSKRLLKEQGAGTRDAAKRLRRSGRRNYPA